MESQPSFFYLNIYCYICKAFSGKKTKKKNEK